MTILMILLFAAVAGALVLLWKRDVALLAEAVRRAAAGLEPGPTEYPAIGALAAITRDVERLARRTAASQAQALQQRLADDAIVEKLPDKLILLGPDRTPRRANAAAREAFGQDLASLLRHPGLVEAIDRALTQENSPTTTVDLVLPVPVIRDVRATVIPLSPLQDGSRAALVLSDRSRERAVERMRVDFVANVSHELRTPLASLIGFIDTLRGPAADDAPAQQRFLGIMAEQAERMNRLIDDLLQLSRIELNEHQPPAERIFILPLLNRAAAGFEPRLQARPMTLQMVVPEALPMVQADADQIMQVLQNLLDNAIKYGRAGGTVTLSATVPAACGKFPARPGLVISVRDDGAGIAKAHLPRLTERFYRADKSRSRAIGGTGLGLAIVKHIVNRHRGQLLIESEEGSGTCISVWLPAAP